MNWYRLNGKKPVLLGNSVKAGLQFGLWRANAGEDPCRVGATYFKEGEVRVSTVFLGLDHGWNGKPLLFETMVFGGKHDQYQSRCSTWEEAEAMHARVCHMVGETLQPSPVDAEAAADWQTFLELKALLGEGIKKKGEGDG